VVRFQQEVEAAIDALLLQQVILYPTDTVWGLGCDAESPPAVKQLYKLKGREAGKPSIVLVADWAMLQRYVSDAPAELEAMLAADTRPTTYILPASRALAPDLIGPDGTVGLRLPKDEFCHKVVRRLGHGRSGPRHCARGRPRGKLAAGRCHAGSTLTRSAVGRGRQAGSSAGIVARYCHCEAELKPSVLSM
jgi:hypothetical protein